MTFSSRFLANSDRRQFLKNASLAVGSFTLGSQFSPFAMADHSESVSAVPFKISLAEWSLHKAIQGGKMTNLDFPRITREEFDIEAVEYVSVFFKDKARDEAYLSDLDKRCQDHGVKSLLIMVDAEGKLGDPDDKQRTKAVENHRKWLDAAVRLGCHSIRVNAASAGEYDEQMKLAADGLGRLGKLGAEVGINVLVENHGGLSSNGKWLAGVMDMVNMDNVGTLPDFGNFRINGWGEKEAVWYDRYQGMEELMPYAKAVSAKSREFDSEGNETQTDFWRVMKTVLDAGYSGYVGIEWEGGDPDEYEGIRLTKRLLEKIRDQHS